MPLSRKRRISVEAELTIDSSAPLITKRRKLENQRRHRTPSSFWDNLSRQWLTPRTLQEFDRRTEWPVAPVPPDTNDKKDIDIAQLKRFARHGGPALGDLRTVSQSPNTFDEPILTACQYPEPEIEFPSNRTMSLSQRSSRKRAKIAIELDTSSKTKRSSAYDPAFEQHLIDHGVYPEGYDGVKDLREPHNLEEINARLALPRASMSPSRFTREDFLDFKGKNQKALTENIVMSKVFPIIAGTADIPSQGNLLFGNLKDLTDGSITKAKPDLYDGSRPAGLKKQVREDLGPYIVPSSNTAAPCLPNFFTEAKGPKGASDVCKRQALYDGALGARGIQELRSYVDPNTSCDDNAYTVISTYHGGSGALKLYATHCTRSTNPNRGQEFRMTQLRGWDMTDNPDTFRQGARALRNARDWAKEKREELIARVNGKVLDTEHEDLMSSTDSFVSLSPMNPTHSESETSADESALGIDTSAISSREAPVGARIDSSPNVPSIRRSTRVSRASKKSGTS